MAGSGWGDDLIAVHFLSGVGGSHSCFSGPISRNVVGGVLGPSDL